MTYYTVFGRLLGDDDDSCLVTRAKNDHEADDVDPEEFPYTDLGREDEVIEQEELK